MSLHLLTVYPKLSISLLFNDYLRMAPIIDTVFLFL